MQTNEARTACHHAIPGAPTAPRRRAHSPLLGIAWRLGLGLAAIAAVLVGAEVLATRTTRDALEAVRLMQSEQEPLASRADAVLEKLVAYDRAVGAFVQGRPAPAPTRAPSCAPGTRSRRRWPPTSPTRRRRPPPCPPPPSVGAARAADAPHRDARASWRPARRSARR